MWTTADPEAMLGRRYLLVVLSVNTIAVSSPGSWTVSCSARKTSYNHVVLEVKFVGCCRYHPAGNMKYTYHRHGTLDVRNVGILHLVYCDYCNIKSNTSTAMWYEGVLGGISILTVLKKSEHSTANQV
ncbi:hypothetical protein OBBRIDRAFT_104133 [Obba rivulosa]|uniref:Uncharacterized protein n=1 Tax=Obba rivulosa TaxID=1052685 RepID=A0A8E2DS65_9APHY|nr:hypothetical protein OBBRIDRAFT_104133 [Obba rivulosa]